MNKQQKNYIKAVVGFVLAAIILCAGIMTALYLMREEKGMENLMAPVLKRLIAGILLFGLTVCWRHFLKKSVSKVAGIIAIVLLSLFFAWHISGIPQEKALKPQNVNLEKAEFRGYEINGNHFLIKEARPFIKYKMQSSKIANVKVYFEEPVAQDTDVKISYQTKEKPTYEQNPSSFWKQDRAAVCIRSYRIKCKLQGACAEKTDNNDNLFYDVFAYAGLLFAIISCG